MKKVLIILAPLLVMAAVYFFTGPYLFPTSTALGPCWKDWTSPASFMPRASPLETLDFSVGAVEGRLCYGAPSSRGRRLFGPSGLVPPGRLWRMGANEPTRLFLNGPIRLGDLELQPGRYSLYARPDAESWEIHVSESTWHWGNMIRSGVRDQEVGSFRAPAIRRGAHQEVLQFAAEDSALVLKWGFTRVRMPISEL
ncbi:MAG: DUF2911 domain-containing protein [Rhodothermales bacterium]|nr:DUF2911 domain-containing protein [Rhodothermales bacterium]